MQQILELKSDVLAFLFCFVQDCLRQGLTESPVMTHQDSIDLMETMDRIRAEVGLVYPADA